MLLTKHVFCIITVPGVAGVGGLNAVDAQLVGNIFQCLQTLGVGAVVAVT